MSEDQNGKSGETLGDLTERMHAQRATLLKVHVIGDRMMGQGLGVEASSQGGTFDPNSVVEPPWGVEPSTLYKVFEQSSALRSVVDAMITNIDGFGHHLEPVIDLTSDDADGLIRDAIALERMAAAEEAGEEASPTEPSDSEVGERKKQIDRQMRFERQRLENFFASCTVGLSFVSLRRRTRQDLEVTGNGYWEVLRNKKGVPVQLNRLPGSSMKIRALDKQPSEVRHRIPISLFTYTDVMVPKQFRSYVQTVNGESVYFKELGDTRIMSNKSGTYYSSEDEMHEKEKDGSVKPATEVLHFDIAFGASCYGVPRYMGALLAVLGTRAEEETNYLYFDNKSIPPMMMFVSGGRLRQDSVELIEKKIEETIKGRTNFHKIIVVEAEGGGQDPFNPTHSQMKIELKPLTQFQQSDALFQKYDERNAEKVGAAYRLPKLLRGDARDHNRSTAEAALSFAESQVFAPEREEFDWVIQNRIIIGELGVRLWRFRSNSPVTNNPAVVVKMIADLMREGVFTPDEARQLASAVFNRSFKRISADWAHQPFGMTLAGIYQQDDSVVHPSDQPASQTTDDRPQGGVPVVARAGGPPGGETLVIKLPLHQFIEPRR